MAGEMSEREVLFSLYIKINLFLRRETKRVVDVEWMVVNSDYVREILTVCRATESPELHELSQRIEMLHPQLPSIKATPIVSDAKEQDAKYLFSLR